MIGPLALDIEDRLFRRGVSDQEVGQAIELVREYIDEHGQDLRAPGQGWSRFGEFYEELTRNLSLSQVDACEIAVDTLLVSAGALRWSAQREQSQASAPMHLGDRQPMAQHVSGLERT